MAGGVITKVKAFPVRSIVLFWFTEVMEVQTFHIVCASGYYTTWISIPPSF